MQALMLMLMLKYFLKSAYNYACVNTFNMLRPMPGGITVKQKQKKPLSNTSSSSSFSHCIAVL